MIQFSALRLQFFLPFEGNDILPFYGKIYPAMRTVNTCVNGVKKTDQTVVFYSMTCEQKSAKKEESSMEKKTFLVWKSSSVFKEVCIPTAKILQ